MRVTRLFTEQPLSSGAQVLLQGTAVQYLGRVLRANVGDAVTLFNGGGEEFVATITEVGKRTISVLLGASSVPATESPVHTTLGLCLSKGDRFDWAVQKATELGVGAIVPLYSERVDFSIPADRVIKRVNHWRQIAISACEQCGRVKVPLITPPEALDRWVAGVDADDKWVLHRGDPSHSPEQTTPESAALLIGPEGGLTDEELALAQASSFHLLPLGPRVLRTETAPVVALGVLSFCWREMTH